MSQNPAHTPRRPLAPPAVTRFQLRTASATEAVFSPPYIPPRPESAAPRAGADSAVVDQYRELPQPPAKRVQPTSQPPAPPISPDAPRSPAAEVPQPPAPRPPAALPPPARSRELPRPRQPERSFELPPPATRETVADRTEPGTWQEILARFERDLGDLTDEATGGDASDANVRADDLSITDAVSGVASDADVGADDLPGIDGVSGVASDADAPADDELTSTSPEERTTEEPEPVAPGDPTSLGPPEPWEVGAMTTPDYRPPQSIHDAGHDAWPVEADDGSAVPAWDNGDESADDDDALDDIGELLLDEVVPADPWDTEPEPDEPDSEPFPLDAFIVPAGVTGVSRAGDDEVALRVAHRLDELARRLRDDGLGSLGRTSGVDELSRVLAAIVTGYVAGDTRPS
jgi:hypothetical protein